MSLAGNAELYEYLSTLHSKLIGRGAANEAAIVAHAMMTAGGMPTEFLGESMLALRAVLKNAPHVLSPGEISEILDVVRQLEEA